MQHPQKPVITKVKNKILAMNSTSLETADSRGLVAYAAEHVQGLAQSVAQTVLKFGKCSERQAYTIARGLVEKEGALREYFGPDHFARFMAELNMVQKATS